MAIKQSKKSASKIMSGKRAPAAKAAPRARQVDAPGMSGGVQDAIDPRLADIAKAYRADPRVSMGKLFATMGLRVNGKIFAMVNRGRLVVKLPKARVDEFVAKGLAERFEPGPGRVMKEWAVFAGTRPTWASLAQEAYEFVGSLSAAE